MMANDNFSPEGITIRRLTQGMGLTGIVRGSSDGGRIAFAAPDSEGVEQIFCMEVDWNSI